MFFENNENFDKSFQKLKWLHLISFVFQSLFLVAVVFYSKIKGSFSISHPETLIYIQYILIFTAMGAIPLSEYFMKHKIKKALTINDTVNRLQFYMTAIIFKLALIEFVNMLTIVVLLLTGQKTYIYISVILVLFFMLSRPGKEKIQNDLHLDL